MLPAATNAATATLEAHDRITRVATTFALTQANTLAPGGATVRVEAVDLDPRLRLPKCAQTPEAFAPPGHRPAHTTTVGVRCRSNVNWSLYVPVRVEIVADVLIVTAPLARGDLLTQAGITTEPRNLATLTGGYLTDSASALGMVLRRAVRPGTTLTPDMLEPARLIRRGERVQVQAGSGSFIVYSEGEALADAAAGQRVRVRNTRSGQVIEGTVDDNGVVRAGLQAATR